MQTFKYNVKEVYIPSEYLINDEELEPFIKRCSFKQHMQSKSEKYGLNIFALCDVDSCFFYPLRLEL